MASGEICEQVIEGTHIYYKAPDLRSVIYLVNRAVGVPGARVNPVKASITYYRIEQAYDDVLTGLQRLGRNDDPLDPNGPFSAVSSPKAVQDSKCLRDMSDIEKRIIDFLPTAIARLKEICTGVIIRKVRPDGVDRTYNLTPNRRAIRYLASRVDGGNYSVIPDILEREREAAAEPRKCTEEEIKAMNGLELILYSNARTKFESNVRNREWVKAQRGAESPLQHVAAAFKLMSEFMPAAMYHMNSLAVGAVTRLDHNSGSTQIKHAPDPFANQYLLNRFAGRPAKNLPVRNIPPLEEMPNKETLANYTTRILKLCKKHTALKNPETVQNLLAQIAGKHLLSASLYAQ
jgi:hypothetical protein